MPSPVANAPGAVVGALSGELPLVAELELREPQRLVQRREDLDARERAADCGLPQIKICHSYGTRDNEHPPGHTVAVQRSKFSLQNIICLILTNVRSWAGGPTLEGPVASGSARVSWGPLFGFSFSFK